MASAYCKEVAADAAIDVVTQDWLEGDAVGSFEVGYDYTYAPPVIALGSTLRLPREHAWAQMPCLACQAHCSDAVFLQQSRCIQTFIQMLCSHASM